MRNKKWQWWQTVIVVVLISIDGGNYPPKNLIVIFLIFSLLRLSINYIPTVQFQIITRIQEAFIERFPDAKLADFAEIEGH